MNSLHHLGVTKTYRVWDPLVRIFHWALVVCVLSNYFLTEAGERLHEWTGYVACALIAVRIVWGFLGTPHARFTDFWPTPTRLKSQIQSMRRGRPDHYVGHSPMGALMMLVLVALVLMLGITGWMQGLDAFFGDEVLQTVHEVSSHALMILAALHVLAALILSRLEKTNLIKAMLTGVKIQKI